MKLNYKRIMIFAVILVLIIVNTSCEAEDSRRVIDPTPEFYINDFAELLTPEERNEILKNAVAYADSTGGIQIVITTIKNFDQARKAGTMSTLDDIATVMYNQYGIGKDSMGVLFLLSYEEGLCLIRTGRKMEEYITDRKAGEIRDKSIDGYFENGQFAEGFIFLQNEIMSYLDTNVPNDWAESENIKAKSSEAETQVDSRGAQTETNSESIGNTTNTTSDSKVIFFWLAALSIFIIANWFGRKVKRINKKINSEQQRLYGEITSKDAQISKLKSNIERLTAEKKDQGETIDKLMSVIAQKNELLLKREHEIEELKDKLNRISILHPEYNFETEIKEMIEAENRAAAKLLESTMAAIYGEKPEEDKISEYRNAIETIKKQRPEVMNFYTGVTIAQFRKRIESAEELCAKTQAAEVTERIKVFLHAEGTKDNYNEIKRVYDEYCKLSTLAKSFVEGAEAFLKIYKDAAEDHKNYTSAENFNNDLKAVISASGSASRHNLFSLRHKRERYDNLPKPVKKYVDDSLIKELDELITEAQNDEDNHQRAIVRSGSLSSSSSRSSSLSSHRSSSLSSHRSSSFGTSSGSHHSGMGGKSFGGGSASRSFRK